MAKVIGSLKGKSTRYKEVKKNIRNHAYNFVRNEPLAKMEEIVGPFESDIVFVTQQFTSDDGHLITQVFPRRGIPVQNPSPDVSDTYDLYKALDDGTNRRYYVLPDEFRNETFPNSLNTISQNYNRNDLRYVGPIFEGIAPRNWGKLIIEEYGPRFESIINRTIAQI